MEPQFNNDIPVAGIGETQLLKDPDLGSPDVALIPAIVLQYRNEEPPVSIHQNATGDQEVKRARHEYRNDTRPCPVSRGHALVVPPNGPGHRNGSTGRRRRAAS